MLGAGPKGGSRVQGRMRAEFGGRALVAALLLPALAACAGGSVAGVVQGERDDRWNDAGLLEWVAAIGEPESRWDELESVRRFERLQRAIEEVKQLVLHDARTPQEAAEGLRAIVKHLAVANLDTLARDFRDPLEARRDPRPREVGAYNPDAEYDQAFIDGRFDYVLEGDVGDVPYLSITVNARGETEGTRAVAYLDDAQIRAHTREGHFRLWLTKERPAAPGAWVALPDAANGVVVRQYVADRGRDELARFSLRALDDDASHHPGEPEIARRLGKTADYLLVASTWHRTLLPQMRERPNDFVARPATAIGSNVANTENYYQMAYWELDPGEALLVDVATPESVYWNLTSATIWHESHRHLSDPVSLTAEEAERGDDGTLRFVLAPRDPGLPNWIDSFGHGRGFLILRIVGVDGHPLPTTRVVSAAELARLE